MTTTRLMHFIRSAAVAATLGATALTGLPAHAANVGFSFGFDFGNGSIEFGNQHPKYMVCMTDRQIRREMKARGYYNIYLNVANGKYIQIKATKGKWVYIIKFNYCTNDIVDRYRLHRA